MHAITSTASSRPRRAECRGSFIAQRLDATSAFIEQESQDRAVAEAFVDKLTGYCEHLARLPGLLGRPRPELGPDYRSTTFGNYVIFLRYADEESPRSHLYIVHVLHGARDIDAYFGQHPGDDRPDN
jgi:toxin ParE1/3/4